MSKQYWYWIADHSTEHCILLPVKVKPVLKRSTITKMCRNNIAQVLSDNGCTTWVPRAHLFATPEEAWADYKNNKETQ